MAIPRCATCKWWFTKQGETPRTAPCYGAPPTVIVPVYPQRYEARPMTEAEDYCSLHAFRTVCD